MTEKRFSRIFWILANLSPHSQVRVCDLAKECEVDSRTIQRDINVLCAAQLGVFIDDGKVKIHRVGYQKIKSWMTAF